MIYKRGGDDLWITSVVPWFDVDMTPRADTVGAEDST